MAEKYSLEDYETVESRLRRLYEKYPPLDCLQNWFIRMNAVSFVRHSCISIQQTIRPTQLVSQKRLLERAL
jgi:hypothetical protein